MRETAEEIKINIGAAYRRPELVTMEVRGRNLVTGLPKTIVVTSDETLEALREPAMQIVDAVQMYWNVPHRSSRPISSTAESFLPAVDP